MKIQPKPNQNTSLPLTRTSSSVSSHGEEKFYKMHHFSCSNLHMQTKAYINEPHTKTHLLKEQGHRNILSALSKVSDTAEEPLGSATGEEMEGQPSSSSGSNAQSRSGNAVDAGKSRPLRSKSTPVKQGEK